MPTTTTDPPIDHVTLPDGTRLAWRQLGAGPAVLLVHGWPTSSHLWRNVMMPIGERHRVLALDLPGFASSTKPATGRFGFERFEQALTRFLDHLGIERVALAGHDLGGPVVVHWALRHPDRVTRLALLNTLLYPEFSPAVVEFVTA
ncbi:MAG: alpha/beta fold hydrolase, partial [Acidimicrobiia bacterium]|nr:alpha/beta fold hydrolase [Acidimicrobiia bacterium]